LKPQHLAAFAATITAVLALGCGSTAPQRAASPPDISSSPSLTLATTPPTAGPQSSEPAPPVAPASSTPPPVTYPIELHFSADDIHYLNSVDSSARDLAIQQRREEIQANQKANAMTAGYTDSLKKWSISTSKAPKTR
jgi:hypothetical protein